jgi:crotonobetainyl-CoA:carnitine CoA-transferase CaiB-like acyl-CoA transferase
MSLPLEDIRVADFSQLYAGPMASMLLADQGAQVVKVESLDGDSSRAIDPINGTADLSPTFIALNRNKKSIVIDLSSPSGMEVVHRLANWVDVAIFNPSGGGNNQHGIRYEDLALINPALIYVSITGYGRVGPDIDHLAHETDIQRKSGALINGRLPDGTLIPSRTPYSHVSSGILNAYAIMVALSERDSTGKGQMIETNFLHTSIVLQSVQLIKYQQYGQDQLAPPFPGTVNCFPCNDGKYIQMNVSSHHWRRYCYAMGLEHMAEDPFDTPPKRTERREIIYETFAARFINRSSAEWEVVFNEATVPATVVQDSVQGVFDDPQVVANNMFIEFQQPGLGTVTLPSIPFSMSDSKDEPRILRHAPGKGEHTDEMLISLGYSEDDIRTLKTQGAVA